LRESRGARARATLPAPPPHGGASVRRIARLSTRLRHIALGAFLVWGLVVGLRTPSHAMAREDEERVHQITVPQEDRFTPFALTIHRGESVEWVNQDTDDHTVVSDDAFTTVGHTGTNHLLPGTDSNHGQPGVFRLRFTRLGTFVYYCRFHAHLDADQQPVAPGPGAGPTPIPSGIQDPQTGNFGTPMMGTITVVP